jgi:benzoate/toluate 1,2-dioxygenase beta subunit
MAKRRKAKAKIAAPVQRRVRPLRSRGPRPAPEALDLRRCEHFLLHEARLLDEGKFDDWLALFTLDAWYWVPSEPAQDNPHDTVSLIYDDRRLLETRVRRLASPRIYSQEPRSRTSRIIGNVSIEEAVNKACTVRSKFVVVEYRRETQRLFAGTALHRLVQTDAGILIASKRVDLVNCDAPLDGLVVPF